MVKLQLSILVVVVVVIKDDSDQVAQSYTHTQHECLYNWRSLNIVFGKYHCQFLGFHIVIELCKMLTSGELGEGSMGFP